MSSNSVVIVTGASRGIGKATSLHLIKKGISVVGVARSADALTAISQEASEISGSSSAKFISVVGDASDDAVQQSAVDQAVKQGTLVALINNAGNLEPIGSISSVDIKAWTDNLKINFIAPFQFTQKVLPLLRSVNGRIVNLTSSASKAPFPEYAVYSGAKAAINHITSILAVEEPDITAVAVHPGAVETELLDVIINRLKSTGSDDKQQIVDNILKDSIPPSVPGAIIAGLALKADHSLSGKYVAYNDPEIAAYAQ
ncbi:hypothetical protein GGI12_002223 [Dipsacomyces acuminosporus]|nr:hypothetical protein GGI12_002223 [Dipsacomyces acuminosporus]